MIINYINNCQEPYILAEEIEENIDNGLVSKKDKFKFKEFVNEYIFKTGKMYTGMELEVNDDLKEWTENYFGALIQEHKAEAKMNNQIKQSDNAVEKKQDKSIFIETKEDIECEF